MAVAKLKREDWLEEIMSQEDYKSVLEVLSRKDSIPFLELSSLLGLDEVRLEEIVDDLESKGTVKITSRDNILDEIVTLMDDAVEAVSATP